MADVYTQTSGVDYDSTAWNMRAWYALRPRLIFDQFATVSTSPVSTPGSAVKFAFAADLAAAVTPLTEIVTPDSVAITDTTVTLNLAEYGNVVKLTRYLQATSFIPFDPIAANVVGFNAGLSMDNLARTALTAGTQVVYSDVTTHVTRVTQASTDIISSTRVRYIAAKLDAANVMPLEGGMYVGVIHPDVAYDLRSATDLAGWRAANTYVNTALIQNGEMGEYEGVRFIKSSDSPILTNAGVTTTDVYQTVFFGQDALAKGYATGENATGPYPQVRPGPVVDPLYRFAPMGWYWLGVFGILRDSAVYRLETASSIGANAS